MLSSLSAAERAAASSLECSGSAGSVSVEIIEGAQSKISESRLVVVYKTACRLAVPSTCSLPSLYNRLHDSKTDSTTALFRGQEITGVVKDAYNALTDYIHVLSANDLIAVPNDSGSDDCIGGSLVEPSISIVKKVFKLETVEDTEKRLCRLSALKFCFKPSWHPHVLPPLDFSANSVAVSDSQRGFESANSDGIIRASASLSTAENSLAFGRVLSPPPPSSLPTGLPQQLPNQLLSDFSFSRLWIDNNLRDKQSFTSNEKIFILFQMLCALTQIHSVGLYHGALSLSNFLIGSDGQLCLADFGCWYKPYSLHGQFASTANALYFEGPPSTQQPPFILASELIGPPSCSQTCLAPERFSRESLRLSSRLPSRVPPVYAQKRAPPGANVEELTQQNAFIENRALKNSMHVSASEPLLQTPKPMTKTAEQSPIKQHSDVETYKMPHLSGLEKALEDREVSEEQALSPWRNTERDSWWCTVFASDVFGLGCCAAELFSEHQISWTFKDSVCAARSLNIEKPKKQSPFSPRLNLLQSCPIIAKSTTSESVVSGDYVAPTKLGSFFVPSSLEDFEPLSCEGGPQLTAQQSRGREDDEVRSLDYAQRWVSKGKIEHPEMRDFLLKVCRCDPELRPTVIGALDLAFGSGLFEVEIFVERLLPLQMAMQHHLMRSPDNRILYLTDIVNKLTSSSVLKGTPNTLLAFEVLVNSLKTLPRWCWATSRFLKKRRMTVPLPLGSSASAKGLRLLKTWRRGVQESLATAHRRVSTWPMGKHDGVFLWPTTSSNEAGLETESSLLSALKVFNERAIDGGATKHRHGLKKRAKRIDKRLLENPIYLNVLLNYIIAALSHCNAVEVQKVGLQTLKCLCTKWIDVDSRGLLNEANQFIIKRVYPLLIFLMQNGKICIQCKATELLAQLLEMTGAESLYQSIVVRPYPSSLATTLFAQLFVLPHLQRLAVDSSEVLCKLSVKRALPIILKALALNIREGKSFKTSVTNFVHSLLHCNDPHIRVAVLRSCQSLPCLVSPKFLHEVVLPFLISFLNLPVAEIRIEFCLRTPMVVAAAVPSQALVAAALLPCLKGALNDPNDRVIASALIGIKRLCKISSKSDSFLHDDLIGEQLRAEIPLLVRRASPLLLHPNLAIRNAAFQFFSIASKTIYRNDPLHSFVFIVCPLLKSICPAPSVTLSIEEAVAQSFLPFTRWELFAISLLNSSKKNKIDNRRLSLLDSHILLATRSSKLTLLEAFQTLQFQSTHHATPNISLLPSVLVTSQGDYPNRTDTQPTGHLPQIKDFPLRSVIARVELEAGSHFESCSNVSSSFVCPPQVPSLEAAVLSVQNQLHQKCLKDWRTLVLSLPTEEIGNQRDKPSKENAEGAVEEVVLRREVSAKLEDEGRIPEFRSLVDLYHEPGQSSSKRRQSGLQDESVFAEKSGNRCLYSSYKPRGSFVGSSRIHENETKKNPGITVHVQCNSSLLISCPLWSPVTSNVENSTCDVSAKVWNLEALSVQREVSTSIVLSDHPSAMRLSEDQLLIGTLEGHLKTYRFREDIIDKENTLLLNDSISSVLYFSNRLEKIICSIHVNGVIHLIDKRSPYLNCYIKSYRDLLGPVLCGTLDPSNNYLFYGTHHGYLVTIDLRLCCISSLLQCTFNRIPIPIIAIDTRGLTQKLWISVGSNRNELISIDPFNGYVDWAFFSADINESQFHVRSVSPSSFTQIPLTTKGRCPPSDFVTSPADMVACEAGANIVALWRPNEGTFESLTSSKFSQTRSFADNPFILTGSTDRRLRYLDVSAPCQRSCVLFGNDQDDFAVYSTANSQLPSKGIGRGRNPSSTVVTVENLCLGSQATVLRSRKSDEILPEKLRNPLWTSAIQRAPKSAVAGYLDPCCSDAITSVCTIGKISTTAVLGDEDTNVLLEAASPGGATSPLEKDRATPERVDHFEYLDSDMRPSSPLIVTASRDGILRFWH